MPISWSCGSRSARRVRSPAGDGAAVKLVGDWKKALTTTQGMSDRFRKAVRQAMLQEAHFLRGQMVKGITSGAPGGQAFAPLSPITLALRQADGARGTKPLIRTGNLRRSFSVVEVGGALVGGRIFVGVHRSAKNRDGKSLANIAATQEFGKEFSLEKSRKMLRRIFALLRERGIHIKGTVGRDKAGRFTAGKFKGNGDGRIRIKARPFVRPVIDAYAKPDEIKRRFWKRLAKGMGYSVG